MTPIIINNIQKVNCIIQDGIRYCESTDITKQEFGMILIIVIIFVVWTIVLINLFMEYNKTLLANIILWTPIALLLAYCFI